MEKVTKKDLNEHELAINVITKRLGVTGSCDDAGGKKLDQSAFDHHFVTEIFNYAAVNKNGSSVFFENKPELHTRLDIWKPISGSFMPMLNGYDANDWQNSLIERASSVTQPQSDVGL